MEQRGSTTSSSSIFNEASGDEAIRRAHHLCAVSTHAIIWGSASGRHRPAQARVTNSGAARLMSTYILEADGEASEEEGEEDAGDAIWV